MTAARNALASFQRDNGIDDLNTNIAAETGLINGLRAQIDGTAPSTGALKTSEDLINFIESRKLETAVANSGTSSIQVKVLDTPFVPPNLGFIVLIYILGGLLGAFAGLALVYLFELLDRSPRTTQDAAELVGAPVVLRIPEAI